MFTHSAVILLILSINRIHYTIRTSYGLEEHGNSLKYNRLSKEFLIPSACYITRKDMRYMEENSQSLGINSSYDSEMKNKFGKKIFFLEQETK